MVDEKKFGSAGGLKPGAYVLIDDEVCAVKSTEKSKPGKHGSAKVRVVAFNIFTQQKRGLLKSTDSDIEIPIVPKARAQVVAVIGDVVQIMDAETFEIIDEKYQLKSYIDSQQDEIESLKEKNTEIENLQKTILQIQNNMLELQKRHVS